MRAGQTHPALVEVVCEGSPYEMGTAQGVAATIKIHQARLAERKAARFLETPLARDYPSMQQRLAGIAAGAGLGVKSILLFNALEPMLSSVGGCTACPGACSAVAVRGRRSATGEVMLARNFDYLPLVQPFYLVRESRPQRGLRALEFTTAPLAGAVDGINEAGLCITYNYGFATDEPREPAAPISLAIAEALQCCRTVTEAADFICARPRWGGALLMIGDADREIASLEISSTRSHLRRPAKGEDTLFHTNAYSSPPMQEVQIARDAVYTDQAPAPLRGRRLHLSSELRDLRFEQLLAGAEALDADGLTAIMADHGSEGVPGDHTPCVHGSYWYTTACLQFFPKERAMRVAYNTACQACFEEVSS